jgi:hypothetical protein
MVNRPVEEVTDPRFLASFPGRAFTISHPSSGLLTADTHSWSARGTVLRAYVGDQPDEDGNVLILGDLMVTDPTAIQRILNGERQLSVGYRYELEEGADGGLEMQNLIANHVALVERGRAGNAQIMDSAFAELQEPTGDPNLGDPSEVNDEDDEGQIIPMKKTQDQNEDQNARLDKLCSLLEKLCSVLTSKGANDTLLPAPTLSKNERGSNPVVDDLRRLRPAIEASRDRRAIDAYNEAITLAKRGVLAPAQTLLSAYDGQPSGAISFEEMVRLRGEDLRSGKLMPSEQSDYSAAAAAERRALDSRPRTETYEETIRRVGREMQGSKFQRG